MSCCDHAKPIHTDGIYIYSFFLKAFYIKKNIYILSITSYMYVLRPYYYIISNNLFINKTVFDIWYLMIIICAYCNLLLHHNYIEYATINLHITSKYNTLQSTLLLYHIVNVYIIYTTDTLVEGVYVMHINSRIALRIMQKDLLISMQNNSYIWYLVLVRRTSDWPK